MVGMTETSMPSGIGYWKSGTRRRAAARHHAMQHIAAEADGAVRRHRNESGGIATAHLDVARTLSRDERRPAEAGLRQIKYDRT